MAWKNKHSKFLEDEKVLDWYNAGRRTSVLNADVSLRNLGLFCERMDTTPARILEMAKTGELRQVFRKYVKMMEDQKMAGSYIVKYKTALNSWIRHNDIPFRIEDKIHESDKFRTVFHEKVPSQSELLSIIRNASKRGRVAISLMAFSGMRPESIGDYEGTDGIRLGDIEGLNFKTFEFDKSPAIITVRDNLSKTRDEYFTLIGDEGITYIKEYLNDRQKEGEKFNKDTPLIRFRWGKDTKRDVPRTLLITREIRDAMRKAGFDDMRPYVLRRYFASALSIGEMRGYITHEWRQFIMGHKGDMEAHYVNAKGNLNDEIKQVVRDSYERCLDLLESSPRAREDSMKTYYEAMIDSVEITKGITMSQDERTRLMGVDFNAFKGELKKIVDEASNSFQDAIINPEASAKFDKEVISKNTYGSRQKVISLNWIEAYVNEGFDFVTSIPGDKAIVRLP